MARLTALALLLAAAVAAAPKVKDFKPRWKDGAGWKVEYSYQQPSAAGVADPGPELRREIWSYQVKAEEGGGWRLIVREVRSPVTQERYETLFDADLRVVKVTQFNAWGQGFEVVNDAEGAAAGFRADSVRAPFLDWPEWDGAAIEKGSAKLVMEKRGYNGFQETFVWKKGKPWWTEAERRYSGSAVKARTLGS